MRWWNALELVAYLSQKISSDLDVVFRLDTLRPHAVDDSHNSASLFRICHDHLDSIRRSAENLTYLGDILDDVENVDGESVFHEEDKTMSAGELDGICLCQLNKGVIIPLPSDERRSRRFAKADAKFHLRIRLDDCFVNIFHRFYEVGLAKDKIRGLGFFNSYAEYFH